VGQAWKPAVSALQERHKSCLETALIRLVYLDDEIPFELLTAHQAINQPNTKSSISWKQQKSCVES
jgi:hypothetical protein